MPTLPDSRELLRGVLSSSVDQQPTWATPHTWGDEDGLYASADQAWLYRQLPPAALRQVGPMRELLLALAGEFPGRQVHLLTHSWEHLPAAGTSVPAPLAAFQKESLSFLAPTRTAAVGVELLPSAGHRAGLREEVALAIDELLGEQTPDLSAYDADRARVSAVLASAGAFSLTRETSAFLESWFTLGAIQDIEAVETDDAIRIGNSGSVIELATAGPLEGTLTRSESPDAERGANVLSVRGTLSTTSSSNGQAQGVLMRTSIIFGRRSERPTVPYTVELRALKSVTPQPLPLRQLNALHETLPCSPMRLAPNHQRVGADQLAALGFGDPGAPGADSGLLLGRGGSTMTRPVYLNPLSGNRLGLILGESRSGKTFTCEALATQARLGGFAMTYLSAGTDAGAALTALLGVPTWQPAAIGDLDPARWVRSALSLPLAELVVGELDAGLDETEANAVRAGFDRAARVGTTDLLGALALMNSPTGVAKVRRALTRDPAARLLSSTGPATPGAIPEACRVDLGYLATNPRVAAIAAALLVAHVAATATEPHLVVVDDLGPTLAHPAWAHALAAVAANPMVSVWFTATELTQAPGALREPAQLVVLATGERAALELTGIEATPSRLQWLEHAHAVVDSGVVHLSAACAYRGPAGAPTGVSVGPWPAASLAALTRGNASNYQS